MAGWGFGGGFCIRPCHDIPTLAKGKEKETRRCISCGYIVSFSTIAHFGTFHDGSILASALGRGRIIKGTGDHQTPGVHMVDERSELRFGLLRSHLNQGFFFHMMACDVWIFLDLFFFCSDGAAVYVHTPLFWLILFFSFPLLSFRLKEICGERDFMVACISTCL